MKQGNTSLRSALFLGLIACLIYGLGAGLRASIGILLEPIADMTGLSYEEVSFSIAVMQIVFGASQPLFGLLAARWSNRFVLTSGVFFMVLSVLGIKLCTSYGMLIVTLGVLMGLGTGAIAFGLVLSSAISFVGQERSLFLAGLLNASAGMVNFFLAPLLNFSLQHGGVPVDHAPTCSYYGAPHSLYPLSDQKGQYDKGRDGCSPTGPWGNPVGLGGTDVPAPPRRVFNVWVPHGHH